MGGLGGDGDLEFVQGMDLMKNFSNHRPFQKKDDFIDKSMQRFKKFEGHHPCFLLLGCFFKKEFDNRIQLDVWVFWYKKIVTVIAF